MDLRLRKATAQDAPFLAPRVDDAAEGLTSLTWTRLAQAGQTPLDVGIERIGRDDLAISYRHAWICEADGQPAGCLYVYRQADEPDETTSESTPVFAPLDELERMTFGTGYIAVLATAPDMRGRGVGGTLLQHAEAQFRGPRGMSLIVADTRDAARRLYARAGFVETARRRMVKDGWSSPGEHWILLHKP